ncbi:MAG: glycosyltransferase [Canidatus Methanoxibalbensis ujae]|nr:glycosyltransferase [Candidatus Methanoxibalbensis ujae]
MSGINIFPYKTPEEHSIHYASKHTYSLLTSITNAEISLANHYENDKFNILTDSSSAFLEKRTRAQLLWFDDFCIPTRRVRDIYIKNTDFNYDVIWVASPFSENVLKQWSDELGASISGIVPRALSPELTRYRAIHDLNISNGVFRYDIIMLGAYDPLDRKGISVLSPLINEITKSIDSQISICVISTRRPSILPSVLKRARGKVNIDFYQEFTLHHNELYSIYASSKYLISASHGDGVNMPVYESEYIGLPTVVTDLPCYINTGSIKVKAEHRGTRPHTALMWMWYDYSVNEFVDKVLSVLQLSREQYIRMSKDSIKRQEKNQSFVISALKSLFNAFGLSHILKMEYKIKEGGDEKAGSKPDNISLMTDKSELKVVERT